MANSFSKKTSTLLNALALLIAGILFVFLDFLGSKWLDIILGISVILLGLITLITEFMKEKSLVCKGVVIGAALIALGIFVITRRVAATVLGLIPIVFIVLGACIFMDAFLLLFWRKSKNGLLFFLEFAIGALLITLGILFLTVGSFAHYMSIAFGVILIVYALYILVKMSTSAPREKKKSKK